MMNSTTTEKEQVDNTNNNTNDDNDNDETNNKNNNNINNNNNQIQTLENCLHVTSLEDNENENQEKIEEDEKEEEEEKEHRRRKKRRRRIRFAEYDDVMEIPHIDDLPPDEVKDVWIGHEEFQSIRRECVGLVALIDESLKTSKQIDFCVRGLDQHTPKYIEMREAIQQLMYETVARINQIQQADGNDYTEVLARLCQTCSSSSVTNAIAIGRTDARAVDASEVLVPGGDDGGDS